MACINIKNPEYIALSNSLSQYGLTNQGIIQAYIHEYQEETNSDNYPDISYFKDEFITVQGDIATEEPSLFIYKGDNLVGHIRFENTGDQLIEREVNVYTPGRGIGSFVYSKIAEIASQQGFQFRSDDHHSEAGTNLWESLVRQDKAEKLNDIYYYKRQENIQANKEQLNIIEPQNIIKEGVEFVFDNNPELASIGSKELYSQYLDTIFPNSKVKDIVYHGTDSDFLERGEFFDKSKIGSQFVGDDGFFGKGFYFTGISNQKYNYGKNSYPGLLNIINPLDLKDPTLANIRGLHGKKDIGGYDGVRVYISPVLSMEKVVFGKKQLIRGTEGGYSEIAVFEPEQIHILGSKKDIEGFKNYVSKNQVKQSDIINNFEQYFPDYSYLDAEERQLFIKGIESGDLTINCKI